MKIRKPAPARYCLDRSSRGPRVTDSDRTQDPGVGCPAVRLCGWAARAADTIQGDSLASQEVQCELEFWGCGWGKMN